ncbi:methionine ABC transporter ATP-binding protein [Clostridium senegalense]|uniref:methionine ABC transporter ATP-binding protein n=1 Tax=Clostridium senegalense TaxID=1465809 RepID=UPI000287C20D|nr:ATP-binding cassette domain-containing protein [Clostridium senegalense]MBU5225438.1 ATP-binding cassette domain-containing protein [Clostridium senegalense]
MIKINNLTKIYKSKNLKEIIGFENLNLTINEGDIFGIIGPSGAGKSSVLRCINLLEKPTKGEILFKNILDSKNTNDFINILDLSDKELISIRKKIGVIFQNFNLLMNSTVFENIAFPLRINKMSDSDITKKVNELLKLVDLYDKKDSYPSQLSGGQKQRVGIARALANDPKVLLCDEATSALDPSTTDSILSLLKSINEKFNITIILITHEMDVIKTICNKVAVLDKGKIVEQGYVTDIFANPTSNITKNFLNQNINIPSSIKDSCTNSHSIVKLTFLGSNTTTSTISHISRKFNVDINIISGNIDIVQNIQIGHLIVNIASNENLDDIRNYLINNDIGWEVLN